MKTFATNYTNWDELILVCENSRNSWRAEKPLPRMARISRPRPSTTRASTARPSSGCPFGKLRASSEELRRVFAVRADAAHARGEINQDIRARIAQQAANGVGLHQVVVGPAGQIRYIPLRRAGAVCDDEGAEEARAVLAHDADAAAAPKAGWMIVVSGLVH